jgi:glucose-6-phosphate isomerase
MIQYDFNNLRAERIGEHGVSDAEINALQPRLQQAFENVRVMRRDKKLGFFDLPYDAALADEITKLAADLRKRFENFVVIGIGGSALGNIAIQSALNHPEYNLLPNNKRRGLRLFVPDNIDPDRLHGLLDSLDLSKTVFNVITKSGNTAESISTYLIARERVIKTVGIGKHSEHFIFTTDASKGELRKIESREKARCLTIPATVGGRFSVLSSVGLLSAAVTGVDIRALLNGAANVEMNQQFDRK